MSKQNKNNMTTTERVQKLHDHLASFLDAHEVEHVLNQLLEFGWDTPYWLEQENPIVWVKFDDRKWSSIGVIPPLRLGKADEFRTRIAKHDPEFYAKYLTPTATEPDYKALYLSLKEQLKQLAQ